MRTFITLAAASLLLSACAANGGGSSDGDPDARADPLSMLQGQAGSGMFAKPPSSIVDALPGSKFNASREFGSVTDVVASGRVLDVSPGSGVVLEDDGRDSPVPFDNENADGRYAAVTMSVKGVVCATDSVDQELHFRIFMNPDMDLDTVRAGLEDMGDFVVFLKHYPSNGDGEYDLAYTHGLIGAVGQDGSVNFPALTEEVPEDWFNGGRTTDQLASNCEA